MKSDQSFYSNVHSRFFSILDSMMTNENDDWEIAVDTGEFDKRLEKDRIAVQVG